MLNVIYSKKVKNITPPSKYLNATKLFNKYFIKYDRCLKFFIISSIYKTSAATILNLLIFLIKELQLNNKKSDLFSFKEKTSSLVFLLKNMTSLVLIKNKFDSKSTSILIFISFFFLH